MEEEIFKDIIGYEGLYKVSSHGRVKSLPKEWVSGQERVRKHNGIFLKQTKNKYGYLVLGLSKEKKRKTIQVHILVAKAFIQNPNNYPLVMHLNDIRDDNYYKNLFFGTHKMNSEDMVNKGRGIIGIKHHKSKLTEEQVLEIRAKYIPRKYSARKLAKEYNINNTTILKIINREYWKHI